MRSTLRVRLAALGVLAAVALAASAEPPKPGRALRVQGNQFVDAAGKPVVFRGVAVSDPDKLEKAGHWNRRIFEEIKAWGANIVRLPVHPAAWRARGTQAYLALLDQGVAWARETGLYVMVDWHVIGNLRTELMQAPMYDTTRKETFEFWRQIARRYRDDPVVVLYELFNEPTNYDGTLGRLDWAQWKPILEEIVGIVRANDPSSIVVVAGLDWAYELRSVLASPIDAPGVAYASHPYPQKREEPWEPKWEADWGHVAARYPVFVSELGFDRHGSVPFVGTPRYGRAVVDYMETRGISWAAWCFDVDWGPTLIEDWGFTPTEQGRLWKAAMLGQPLPTTE
ncbi:MAG TPA: glycoside hydrolase family 5 protein [Vicinamibacteria bacterium]|nr:glycoside hydrolase family 5 protein [Vicinamibacteria bacterium]